MSQRMQQLQQMLQREPDDPFLVYGLAMEYKKAGQPEQAIEHFNRVVQLDPGYCYAHHQIGLIHESTGDLDAARAAYRAGAEAAKKKGDAHAEGEIAAALEMIE